MAASALRAHLYCPHAPHPSRFSLVASPSPLSLLRLSSLHCSHTNSLKFSQSLRISPPESNRESAGLVMCIPESSDVGKTASAVISEEPTSHQAHEVLPLNGEEAEAQVSNGSLAGHEGSLDSAEETDSDEAGEEIAGRVWDDATIISAQESYGEVNKIIASRAIEKRMFYFIEWKDGHEPSWLPFSSIAKDVLAEYESPWWKAARAVDEQRLRELLEDEGRDMDAVDENGRTALLFASGLGSEKCVRLLVEAGADVDGQDLDGLTPLHMAAGYVKQKTVTLLLELGADPEIEDSKGRTPLTLAEELIGRTPKANPLQFARRLALENILKLLESEVFENAEVEQVLDKRPTNKGSVEYLVKWKDGSEDEWVSAESVADDLVQDYEAGLEYGIAEEILDKRDENGQVEYLVKWADIEKPTWEPPENVASELIAEYEKMPVSEVEKMLQQRQKSDA